MTPFKVLQKIPEVNSKVNKRNRIPHSKYEVQQEEKDDILTTLNDQAFMLYQYYLRMASIEDSFMEDSNAASYFKWKLQKVSRTRKLLEKAGYFKKITYTSNTGNKSITYYISKDRVNNII